MTPPARRARRDVSEREGHAVYSGRSILLSEPDATCDHENNDDCDHFAIWVGTRLATDTPQRGRIVFDLRELDPDTDGDDDVAISHGIVVACDLETGAVEALGREAALFLQHYPWLVESLREEVAFFVVASRAPPRNGAARRRPKQLCGDVGSGRRAGPSLAAAQ